TTSCPAPPWPASPVRALPLARQPGRTLAQPPADPPPGRPPATLTPPVGSAVCRGFGSGQCRFGGELPTSRVGGRAGGGWGESARVGGGGGRRVSGGGRRGRGPRDGAPS